MVYNTAPTFDWLPHQVDLHAGDSKNFTFGEVFDFEGNAVALKYVGLRSVNERTGGEDHSDWLQVQNATVF